MQQRFIQTCPCSSIPHASASSETNDASHVAQQSTPRQHTFTSIHAYRTRPVCRGAYTPSCTATSCPRKTVVLIKQQEHAKLLLHSFRCSGLCKQQWWRGGKWKWRDIGHRGHASTDNWETQGGKILSRKASNTSCRTYDCHISRYNGVYCTSMFFVTRYACLVF
jgi:hypothetical protein